MLKALEAGSSNALGLGPKSANFIPQPIQPHLLRFLFYFSLLCSDTFFSILCGACYSVGLAKHDTFGCLVEKSFLDTTLEQSLCGCLRVLLRSRRLGYEYGLRCKWCDAPLTFCRAAISRLSGHVQGASASRLVIARSPRLEALLAR